MPLSFASFSETGSKHSQNEDHFLCSVQLGLFAVADGMSEPAGGAVASELALRAMSEYFQMALKEKTHASDLELMREAVLAANSMIFQNSVTYPELIGMGTTLTAARLGSKTVTIGHVGDSRCYLYRKGGLRQLTTDHRVTVPSSTEQRIKRLSQCVGFSEVISVDTIEIAYRPSDVFLLCSDGITDFVDETEIHDALRELERRDCVPDEAIRELVQRGKLLGADDDMSVVLFRVE